jgi:hypothetical protein
MGKCRDTAKVLVQVAMLLRQVFDGSADYILSAVLAPYSKLGMQLVFSESKIEEIEEVGGDELFEGSLVYWSEPVRMKMHEWDLRCVQGRPECYLALLPLLFASDDEKEWRVPANVEIGVKHMIGFAAHTSKSRYLLF